MGAPAHRRARRLVGIVACLACAAASLTGAPAGNRQPRQPLRVLQMNLCNSGLAGCYTGRSVAQAAAVIRSEAPDVITLNEICENDVTDLAPALAETHRGGTVVHGFRAALHRRTGEVVRCVNDQPYGIGLLAYVPGPAREHQSFGGVYPMQNTGGEHRVWLCLDASAAFYACTTHLANGSPSVALAQCIHLLSTAIPAMRAQGRANHTVIGGDLNLSPGDALPCVPPGYQRVVDGSVQQIFATTDLVIDSSKTIDMGGATDHAGLFVALGS